MFTVLPLMLTAGVQPNPVCLDRLNFAVQNGRLVVNNAVVITDEETAVARRETGGRRCMHTMQSSFT